MAGKTQTHTDAVLNVLRNITLPGVATAYVSLFSAAPANDNSEGTELAGNNYARQAVTFGAPVTDTGNVRKISNTNPITFGPASADWLQATHFGIHSAASGSGNLLYWDALTTPRTVQNGDSAQFAIDALSVKED